jgi:hypothetical protein
MKRLTIAAFAFPLLLSSFAFAQDTTKPEAQQPTATSAKTTTQEVTLPQNVSTDSNTLISNKDNNGTVDKPDVKGHEATLKTHAEKRRTLSTMYPSRPRQTRCPK